jgi:hypothetical protein
MIAALMLAFKIVQTIVVFVVEPIGIFATAILRLSENMMKSDFDGNLVLAERTQQLPAIWRNEPISADASAAAARGDLEVHQHRTSSSSTRTVADQACAFESHQSRSGETGETNPIL